MLSRAIPAAPATLDEVLAVDAEARARAAELLEPA
jgi:1-deoxy-D-xylulose-5-phosphate reductoisomerase